MIDTPQILKYFPDDMFIKQPIYKSKNKYDVIFINEELYQELFNEKFDWDSACQNILNTFSVTTNKDNGQEQLGEVYVDKQYDPLNIALNGNQGSGRSFYFSSNFNIKGDKTLLATSKKPSYNNGKYPVEMSIKESILSNILAKDCPIKTFQTLALISTNEYYDIDECYIDENDIVQHTITKRLCTLEVRYYQDTEFCRLSNYLYCKSIQPQEIEQIVDKICQVEAYKFNSRFLHGSWSSGNITKFGNMIDLDSGNFVKGRFPQYSNTDNHKECYFGYEILGQQLMINSLCEPSPKIDLAEKYNKYLLEGFCKLIGLDYNKDYEKYNNEITSLFKKYVSLSQKFFPNYYETFFQSPDSNITFLFDFSRFFAEYLTQKLTNNANIFVGLSLLDNNAKMFEYTKNGLKKDKITRFFSENLVFPDNYTKIKAEAINFVFEYDSFFEKLKNDNYNLREIAAKQYFINQNRDYLYNDVYIYDLLDKFQNKEISSKNFSTICNALIKTNIRNNSNICNLKIYNNFLTYCVVSKNSYHIELVKFDDSIEFAKLVVNDVDYMMHHKDNTMLSNEIPITRIDFLSDNTHLLVNGIECKNILV